MTDNNAVPKPDQDQATYENNAQARRTILAGVTTKISYDANNRQEYIGLAKPGTATSAAGWQIKKMTYNATGFMTDLQFADGTDKFDKVWDNKASYSYS